jgi:mannitol/fructose-specific phosphotransferase system IIA component (Ntr-type)
MARTLSATEPVWLIDTNANRCRAAEADGLQVFQGNALNENTLNVTNAAGARVFITMTANPQVNAIARHLARDLFGVPNLLTVPESRGQAGGAGGGGGEGGQPETEVGLLLPVEFKLEEWDHSFARKEVEPTVLDIEESLDREALMVRLLHAKVLPLALERDGRRILPALVNDYRKGDRIHGVRRHIKEAQSVDPFNRLVEGCPVLDLPGPMDMKAFFHAASKRLEPELNLSAKKIFDLLVHRERESSTVIVPGLAIPHIVIPGKQKTYMLIARCREGIHFFEEEGTARIAFVIASTRDERNVHLRVLSAIAQLFQDASFEDTLLTVEEPGKMREVILTTKRRRF